MKYRQRLKFLLALVLICTLSFPQGVFAFGKNLADDSYRRFIKEGQIVNRGQFITGELILKSRGDAWEEDRILRKYNLNIKRRDSRLGYILAAVPTGMDVKGLVRNLQKEETVEYAQLNYKYQFSAKPQKPKYSGPNDPQYSRQWAAAKINARQGWNIPRAAAEVIVAVLDSGIDVNHPDLKNRLVRGTNTVNPLKSARDDEGHGTHVAGIIGAATNNGVGVTGVAGIPGVEIMPVKVFDGTEGSDISISDGIIWAADHGAKVINMSFGSYFRSDLLNDAIDYAYNKGIVMVAAAGNWASQEISYPAALSKVIAVSATDRTDRLAEFSSFGPQIDVSAPGQEIYSTYWDKYKGSTYTELSGTSMAAPMVAGLAAVILARNPKLTNDEVRQIIELSATDLGDPGWDTRYGYGRIDVQKALALTLTKQEDSNGSMLQAVELEDGVPYREKIDSGRDVDWYKIQVPSRASMQVEVLPAGKVSPGVEIYNSEGEVIAAFNTDGAGDRTERKVSLLVAQAVYGLVTDLDEGLYYIKVFGNHFRWSRENYTFTARLFSSEEAVTDPNEPNNSYEEARSLDGLPQVTGAIPDSGDEDWFKIDLDGGTAYRIHLDVPTGLDLAVEVESATNYKEPASAEEWDRFHSHWFWEVIDNAGQSQDEDSVIMTPVKGAGTYYIKVTDASGAAVNANYSLAVQKFYLSRDKHEDNENFKTASSIILGDEVSANFHRLEDVDWYSLEVPGTGILKINMYEPPGTVCNVELYSDPEGNPIGQNSNNSYFSPDSASRADKGFRAYEFKVPGGKLYIKVTNFGSVSAEDYRFKTQYSYFDFTDNETNDRILQANPIGVSETKYGTLFPEGDVDFYVLDVQDTQALLVSLAPPADLDTVTAVFKEDDSNLREPGQAENEDNPADSAKPVGTPEDNEPVLQLVAEINSGGKGQLDAGVFLAAGQGRYYIGVAASETLYHGQQLPKSLGKYALTVKPFKVQPDAWEPNDTMDKATAIASGTPLRPTFMGTEDVDWYKTYVPGPGLLTVNLTVPGDIDGVLEVYSSGGKQLLKADQSMVGEEESASLKVTKGYYYIKTYDYLGNSSVQNYSLVTGFVKK